MRKENVFLVMGRLCDAGGVPRDAVQNYVVCGATEDSMREFVGRVMPELLILSVVGLIALDNLSGKIKTVLSGADESWPVLVEPGL